MSEINIKATGLAGLTTPKQANATTQNQESKTTGVQTGVVTDKVSLTDTANQLQSVQQTVADASAVNKERVNELRAAIADGSYSVDATELAKNMINFEDQLR